MKTEFWMIVRIPRKGHDPHLDQFPALYFHEILHGAVMRIIEIWPNGHTGIARRADMLELGGTYLPDNSLKAEVDSTFRWPITNISAEQFERYWASAVRRLQWDLGTPVPATPPAP